MSLLHRVSSTESIAPLPPFSQSSSFSPSSSPSDRAHLHRSRNSEDRPLLQRQISPDPNRGTVQSRKLSFSPINTSKRQPLIDNSESNHSSALQNNKGGNDAGSDAVGAYEVSRTKRLAQCIVAVLTCLFAAGVVFGFAAFKPVLLSEGVYRDQCTAKELRSNVEVCYSQEVRLNFMFTVAAVSTNVSALPIGTILDRYGPRVASLIGCIFLTAGCLFLAFAAEIPFDGYIPGYLFLALGGPFIFISSFQLSNTFPQNSGLILALLTGAFDTSSAVFLLYRLFYTASNQTFTPKRFFLIYLIVPVLIAISQLTIMPYTGYKTVGELVKSQGRDSTQDSEAISDTETTSLLATKDASVRVEKEEAAASASGVWGALHGHSAYQQILTPWFVLIALFTMLQMARINYFVATIRSQYDYLLHSSALATQLNNFFDIALPLGGVISAPFIGLILDNSSTTFVLALLVLLGASIGVLGVIPAQIWAGYANIALFVLYRPFYYTAISDYAAKVFGFATFGKVYGLIICIAGLFNFIQTGLDALTHRTFRDDPIPVNVALLSVTLVVGIALVVFVYWRSKSIRRENLEVEAEASGATDELMPGADEALVRSDRHLDVYGRRIEVHGHENGNGSSH